MHAKGGKIVIQLWHTGLVSHHSVQPDGQAPISASAVTVGYTAEKAERNIQKGYIDAVAFGRDYIANPDLAERIRCDVPLNEQHPETFYGGGIEGYTDYPFMAEA